MYSKADQLKAIFTSALAEVKPAQLYIEQKCQDTGKCCHCSLDETFNGDKLVNTIMPTTFMSRSLASPDLLTQIIVNKYALALPLDRQRHSILLRW